jgi:hypothetical protein
MGAVRHLALSAVVLCAGLPVAQAAPLSIVSVGAAAVNCVYDAACSFAVNDTVATIPVAGISGRSLLQIRTFTGGVGSSAAAKTGYQYRVNLTAAVGSRCVSALKLPFGPISKMPYIADGPYADIYVVATGDLGTIGLASADRTSNIITVTFSRPVCAGARTGTGESSLFFGLTSSEPPKLAVAEADIPGAASASVPVRAAPVQAEVPKPKVKAKPRSRSSARPARPPPRP